MLFVFSIAPYKCNHERHLAASHPTNNRNADADSKNIILGAL
jgi:hypothetical protein